MDIHVEDVLGDRMDFLQIRFFSRFPQGYAQDVGIAIGMPAEL